MPKMHIDIDELAAAITDHDSEWVLDTKTGQVLIAEWVRDPTLAGDIGLDLDDDGEGLRDGDDVDPLEGDRFVFIEPLASHEGFRWMLEFAQSQTDDRVREHLLDALDRPRPFRRFKDALHGHPEVRESWFRYEDEKLKDCARDWVTYRELDAELVETRERPNPS